MDKPQLDMPHQLTEDRQVAYGLYHKHVDRKDGNAPTYAWWIEVNNTKETGDAAALDAAALKAGTHFRIVEPKGSVFDGVDRKLNDVGVYIIYHAKESSDPNIFGVKPLEKEASKGLQAKRLVGLLEKLKIRPIRKLSLVGCHSDSGKNAASKNFLVKFGNEIQSWGNDDRPMIAGYDDFVSAGWADGQKLAGRGGMNTPKVKATDHKHVWCYRQGWTSRYVKVELKESGWSDKYNLGTDKSVAVVK